MNNIMYFCMGLVMAFIISCNISPLEADVGQECGNQEWNPCYVKIVQ